MNIESAEVLFESTCQHFIGNENETYFLWKPWKKRHVAIYQDITGAEIHIYDRRQKKYNNAPPKVRFSLLERYMVEKLAGGFRGCAHACRLTSQRERLLIGLPDESALNLFTFFVQTQTKLREELEEDSFVVRPDNSECQQKIGARGNMCLLHISQHGVILALQLSKCIVAWWPLRCIRTYESLSRQQFALEAGRRAPMGPGVYAFNTRLGHDNLIYDALDAHVMQAAGLKSIVYRSVSEDTSLGSTTPGGLDSLQSLATLQPDTRFIATLQRISKNIADNQFNSVRNVSTSQSRHSGESQASTDTTDRASYNRSNSRPAAQRQNTPPTELTSQPSANHIVPRDAPVQGTPQAASTPFRAGDPLPGNHSYENEAVESVAMTSRKIKQQNFTSAYLSMNGSTNGVMMNGAQASTSELSGPHSMILNNQPAGNMADNQFRSLQFPHRSKTQPVVSFSKTTSQVCFTAPPAALTDNHGTVVAGDNCADAVCGELSRSAPPKNPDRAISNQYTKQPELTVLSREQMASQSGSDPPTPYERMSRLDFPVLSSPDSRGGSYIEENVYPGAYPRKSQLCSYADPSRIQLVDKNANTTHVGQESSQNGAVAFKAAQSQEYLYPQKQSDISLAPSVSEARLQQSRDLKPPMLKPKPVVDRPTDLYASPKRKQRMAVAVEHLEEGSASSQSVNITKEQPSPRVDQYEDLPDSTLTPKCGIYESPSDATDGLAFANNMFKEELQAEREDVELEVKHKGQRPAKLSIFQKQASKAESTASGRSLSISPITPPHLHPVNASAHIRITPNSKSFKRSQPLENSSPSSPALQTTFSQVGVTTSQDLRRQKSAGSGAMEGRRLPSLPADAILSAGGALDLPSPLRNGEPSPTELQYERVGLESVI